MKHKYISYVCELTIMRLVVYSGLVLIISASLGALIMFMFPVYINNGVVIAFVAVFMSVFIIFTIHILMVLHLMSDL